MSDKTRIALEAAADYMAGMEGNIVNPDDGKFRKCMQQIDEALKESIPDTYSANQVQQMIIEAGKDGFKHGAKYTSQIIAHAEPYEISTKVGAEVDSKGQTKPSAEVKVARLLESDKDISTLIHADLSRGIEECMIAINEVLKRGVAP